MQFEFKNLGTIKEAQIEMGDLTIICGENNTGKTYLTYAVWGFLAKGMFWLSNNERNNNISTEDTTVFFKKTQDSKNIFIKELKNNTYSINIDKVDIKAFFEKLNKNYVSNISSIFASDEVFFSNSSINFYESFENMNPRTMRLSEALVWKQGNEIKINFMQVENPSFPKLLHEGFLQMLVLMFLSAPRNPNILLLPAQRDSIELFYKALDEHNAHTLKELQRTKNMNLLEESPRFPQPIEKLIDFARDLTRQVIKTESFIQKEHPELLQEIEEILGVKYEVLGDEVVIKDGSAQLPAYMASTSVRSLMHLYFWLKHKAQKGDLLMIDEPELNLHPKNQIKMARLFAKLINVGVKIWITTHSDYIIKELNNCLMLSQDFDDKEETLKRLGYKSNEILEQKQVKAYIAKYEENLKGCTVVPVEYDEYGMVMTTFDEQIDKINAISEELSDAIYEKKLTKMEQS